MLNSLKAGMLILYLSAYHEIDFLTLHRQGISRYKWDKGIALLKKLNLIRMEKGKWKIFYRY